MLIPSICPKVIIKLNVIKETVAQELTDMI